jgi:uncharacterized protein
VVVGVCRLSLYFPESGSLKAKRHGLRKIMDRARAKFNVAMAEVDHQDTWQRSTVAYVVVGNEGRHVQSMLDRILSFVDDLYVAQILNSETELINYNDDDPMTAWEE